MRDIVASIVCLEHVVLIKGKDFSDCKAEYDRVCNGVEKDLKERCGLRDLIFSNMIEGMVLVLQFFIKNKLF